VRGERRFLSLNKYLISEVKVELVYSTFEMAKTASLNIRIDPETKRDAEELYRGFGITIT